jgi:Uma2 family endonuclease
MSTQIISHAEAVVDMIKRMPADCVLIQHGVSWNDYEDLLLAVGEAPGLHISFDEGTLQIMSPSSKHEHYALLIERLVDRISIRQRLKVLFYGSTTIKKQSEQKGAEPDACFYVQNADAVGTTEQINFDIDPPPDVVLAIDIHHESTSKLPIYAALGVRELWRFDGQSLTIYHLRDGQYVVSDASQALPILTGAVLTGFLARSPKEDQYDIVLAFEEWLQRAANLGGSARSRIMIRQCFSMETS